MTNKGELCSVILPNSMQKELTQIAQQFQIKQTELAAHECLKLPHKEGKLC